MRPLSMLALGLWLVPACSGGPRPVAEQLSTCNNGLDDDGDGAADCADRDCVIYPFCMGVDGGPEGDAGPVDAPRGDVPRGDARLDMCTAPIDLVFVLDVSTSMATEAAALRDGLGRIYSAATALTPDTAFALVVFVDDALVVNGCRGFSDMAALQAEFDSWRAFCSTNRSPVSGVNNSDCQEASLDAMYAAATMCTWRAGATHVLIHVTDDTFEEPPYVYSRGLFGGGGVNAMTYYSQAVGALLADEIRVGAFAMRVPEDCGAGTSPNTARGFFEPFGGMEAIPTVTGGAVWDLREVRDGRLDMATAISEMVEAEYCTLF
jgi:hypothetical protein